MKALTDYPFRKVDFAERKIEAIKRKDGSIILRNLTPMGKPHSHALAPLKLWAQEAPDRLWLAERPFGKTQKNVWRSLNYQQGWARVQNIAAHLMKSGLGLGDRLMILSGNSIEHALMNYATMLTRAAIVPISPAYSLMSGDYAKLKYVFNLIKPKKIFVQDYQLFAKALEQLDCDDVEIIAYKNAGNHAKDFADFEQEIALDEVHRAYQEIDFDDIAKLLFTSGSTGMPKAAINTHRIMSVNVVMGENLVIDKPDEPPPVSVSWLPWNHIFGGNAILHLILQRGGTLYIDRGRPLPNQFDETILALKEIAPTSYSNVPMAYNMLADALEQDEDMARLFFSRLKLITYGGAALGQDIADRVQKIAVKTTGERILFTTGYGATETGPTIMSVHWQTEKMGLLGLPLPGVEIKLAPVGQKMEVRAKGDCITPGYYEDEDRTKAAFDEEGFYRLGDGAKFLDPNDIEQGLVFDGRVAEDFKLDTGIWVNAGRLRIGVIDALRGLASDCVICGLNQNYIGILVFLNKSEAGKIVSLNHGQGSQDDDGLFTDPKLIESIRNHLQLYNKDNPASSTRIARAIILRTPPNLDDSEITDKGYINQGAVISARADEVRRLYADKPDDGVIII